MFLALTWIPLLFASVTNALQNGALPRHRLGTRLHRPPPHHPHTPSNATFTVDLNIDHFGGAKGTFKNRYWMNDTYYEGGPVFVFDVGETNAEPYHNAVLQEVYGYRSNVMALAKEFKGLGILWEHRYYGESLPFQDKFSGTVNFTHNEWQYLTADQALEDVVVFAKHFTLPSDSRIKLDSVDALRPHHTPWIFLGASYSGVRAALLRVRNPETVFASWSSSGPIQAQINMASYFEAVERALLRNCSADWVAVTKYVDDVLMGSNTAEQVTVKRALYTARMSRPGGNTTLVEHLSDSAVLALPSDDMASVLLDPMNTFQWSGLRYIRSFCDRVETHNFTTSPTSKGINATQGTNATFNAFMVAIAEFESGGGNDNPNDDSSWTWQFCSQFGYYQVADPKNPVNIETTYYSLEWQQALCDKQFAHKNPRQPNVKAINQYGGWHMNPSHVFFSNGEYDPWRTLSINSQESNSPQRNGSETIPVCNTSPRFPSYFGTTYPGQVHGADEFIRPTDAQGAKHAFEKGLSLFSSALTEWLRCYRPASSVAANVGEPKNTLDELVALVINALPRWGL